MANNIARIFDEYSQEDYLCHKLRPIAGGDYTCCLCGNNVDKLIHDNHCEECDEEMSLDNSEKQE